MKRIICALLTYILSMSFTASIADDMILNTGITLNDIPKTFFGSWRVTAKLDDSNSYGTFKPQSVDIWSLSRIGDVIKLSNPFTGASAEITINATEGNLIIFSKKAPYDNKILTDTVSIRLDKDTFKGINTLSLETLSLEDKHVLKTENARYIISGEKISGENIINR